MSQKSYEYIVVICTTQKTRWAIASWNPMTDLVLRVGACGPTQKGKQEVTHPDIDKRWLCLSAVAHLPVLQTQAGAGVGKY